MPADETARADSAAVPGLFLAAPGRGRSLAAPFDELRALDGRPKKARNHERWDGI